MRIANALNALIAILAVLSVLLFPLLDVGPAIVIEGFLTIEYPLVVLCIVFTTSKLTNLSVVTLLERGRKSPSKKTTSPKIGLGLLRLFVRGKERKSLEGDLFEEFNDEIAPEHSNLYAHCWFLVHVLLIVATRFTKAFGENLGVAALFRATVGKRDRSNDEGDGEN